LKQISPIPTAAYSYSFYAASQILLGMDPQGRYVKSLYFETAAGILYPFFGFLLNPAIAAAMAFPSISVVSHALRLQKVRL